MATWQTPVGMCDRCLKGKVDGNVFQSQRRWLLVTRSTLQGSRRQLESDMPITILNRITGGSSREAGMVARVVELVVLIQSCLSFWQTLVNQTKDVNLWETS